MHDLAVVGGGPVGLATALYAVRSGLSVTVLEPRGGVVDKACGEGLMPGGIAALAELGIDPAGWELRGIRYLSGTRQAAADFTGGLGRGVRRTVLHQALSEAVAAEGVEVEAGAATGVELRDGSARISTRGPGGRTGPVLDARYVVAADGLHSPLRRSLGLEAPTRGPQRYGQRRHYGIRPWSSHVEVHWGRHGEAYVTPVGADLVGIAVLSVRRASFEEQLAGFPSLRERLAGAEPVTTVRGSGPLRQRTARRVAGRVLLVGDASGYVDALTGEGISLGMSQARAAVAAVGAGHPESYEGEWRRATWRCAALTHALVQGTRPSWMRRAVVPAASAAPGLFRTAVAELGRVR